MTVAWPYGLADPGLYAYLMTAAAHANMSGYPYPALQSAMQTAVPSPFTSYYNATSAITPTTTRPQPPYPTFNPASPVRDALLHKSNSFLDTMSSLSQASILQQTIHKNSQLQNSLQSQNSSRGFLMTSSPPSANSNVLSSLFQPYKE